MSEYGQLLSSPAPLPSTSVRRQRRPRCRAPSGLSKKDLKTWRRQRASGRELVRIHELREGFDLLRTVIPCEEDEDKYSKVQVLKYAISYIKLLKDICDNKETSAPLSCSWSDFSSSSSPTSYSSSVTSGSEPASPYGADWAACVESTIQSQHWLQTAQNIPPELDTALFEEDLDSLIAATSTLSAHASFPHPAYSQQLPQFASYGQPAGFPTLPPY